MDHFFYKMSTERQLDQVFLHVVEKNDGARRFYENLGFELIGDYCENTYHRDKKLN